MRLEEAQRGEHHPYCCERQGGAVQQIEANVEGMFDQYHDIQTTVWSYELPQYQIQAQWAGHVVYPSLWHGIKAINDNIGQHFAYDVIVHEPGKDRTLTH